MSICSRPRAEQLAEEFPEVNVDIRLMDQLDASIAECDTIFAGERLAAPACLELVFS